MSASIPTRLLSGMIQRAETTSWGRRLLDGLLGEPAVRNTLFHRVSALEIRSPERLDLAFPEAVGDPMHFEDLMWLFSSNYANRGLSQLMLDEAGWLYSVIADLGRPRVAEVGRCKGGTTFLLAAAGANVVSIDNGHFESGLARRNGGQPVSYSEALGIALQRAGIADRVEVVEADAQVFPVDPASFDIVYLDILQDKEWLAKLFDHWWVGVRPGGRLILRDGAEPRNPGASELALELSDRPDLRIEPDVPGRFVVAVRI